MANEQPNQTKAARIAASAPINERALLTRRMAAAYLSVGETLLKEFEASGDLKPLRYGHKEVRYRRTDLDELIDKLDAGTTRRFSKPEPVRNS